MDMDLGPKTKMHTHLFGLLTEQSQPGNQADLWGMVYTMADVPFWSFPNVITPNGDNINDVFAIENLNTNVNLEDPDAFRNNELLIYDRWGKLVYSAKNYDTFARNGQIERGMQAFDGMNLPDGVYYFSFYYKGKAKTVKYNGTVTIIR